jgi:uncharacterized protein YdbL (DUF1318 family)
MPRRIFLPGLMLPALFLFSSLGLAQKNYDLKEMTPEITQAIESRRTRYAELQHFKSTAAVGENNRGFVELLRPLPEATGPTEDENRDRKLIYQAIVDQNHLDPEEMGKVQEVFAEVQRGKARPGEMIQLPSGEWVPKR